MDWDIAILFLSGAVFGGLAGAKLSRHLSVKRGALNKVFAAQNPGRNMAALVSITPDPSGRKLLVLAGV